MPFVPGLCLRVRGLAPCGTPADRFASLTGDGVTAPGRTADSPLAPASARSRHRRTRGFESRISRPSGRRRVADSIDRPESSTHDAREVGAGLLTQR